MTERVYLDYNATTPLAPEVVAAMLPNIDEAYGPLFARGLNQTLHRSLGSRGEACF